MAMTHSSRPTERGVGDLGDGAELAGLSCSARWLARRQPSSAIGTASRPSTPYTTPLATQPRRADGDERRVAVGDLFDGLRAGLLGERATWSSLVLQSGWVVAADARDPGR